MGKPAIVQLNVSPPLAATEPVLDRQRGQPGYGVEISVAKGPEHRCGKGIGEGRGLARAQVERRKAGQQRIPGILADGARVAIA